jgi:t-SNARE complex subunit (syntaxin)
MDVDKLEKDDLQNISNDIKEIKEIVKDLSTIVISQNTKLDLIDTKVDDTTYKINSATNQIKIFEKKHKTKNMIKTAIIGSVISLPVGFIFGPIAFGIVATGTGIATLTQKI